MLLAWAGLMWAFFPGSERYDFTYQVGDIWRRADVEAPFDFAIYKSEAELEREREQVRRQTPRFSEARANRFRRRSADSIPC